MKIVISALHFHWDNIDNCLDTAVNELGVDGVELSLHESFEWPHCTGDDIAKLADANKKHSPYLTAHVWEDLATLGVENAPAKMFRWLDICKQTGICQLVLHGGISEDQKKGVQVTKDVLQKILPDFEKAAVVTNLENHYDYNYKNCRELFSHSWEFLEIFEELKSPSLRFCYDTGHANMNKNSQQLLTELAPYLEYVHLADNHGVDDDHCPYKHGTVAWERDFSLLKQMNFDGVFCVEFPVREDKSPFAQCLKDIRKDL